jgi:hypothetical protein
MGHKTIQMTIRYSHLAPVHQLEAVQRLCDTSDVVPNRDTDSRSAMRVHTERPTDSGSNDNSVEKMSALN